ncbi:MAG: DUF4954 family protein [Phycisphaerae bacterium]|nr:DUF4954 family protein [Phycisphaerae bacterium]
MADMQLDPAEAMGYGFVPGEYLAEGQDEYTLRNRQAARPADYWRNLSDDEIALLEQRGNTSDNWRNVLVADPFCPACVHNCQFYGLVRIGQTSQQILSYHDLTLPVGLTDSCIVSSDIGDDAAVHNVRYLSHFIVGNRVILFNIDEMHTTNHAKFGNGIIKAGEDESVRIRLNIGNEAGGRSIMPFDGQTCADAALWSRYRDDADLMTRLGEITQNQFDSRRGWYGQVGDNCVVKHCRIIKDVIFGEHAYVKGVNKLKNITVNSTLAEPTQIGEGVEMVNGIVSVGCKIFYGCKAVRFVMAPHSNLKYGGRLINSFLGDNSTISCCENLNNLIFPAHEQHHNDSFLIASTVCGQSNIAAGATLGSNHNSRASEGEILAGRGFWPGLCSNLKHNCRFASFTLIAKGGYPAELDIRLPFSLISTDPTGDRLLVMPAYWWIYNMYALARNSHKFLARDKRKVKTQHIEFDFLAPDTAEEMFTAMERLEVWTAKAKLRADGKNPTGIAEDDLAAIGRALLAGDADELAGLEVLGEDMECSRRKTVILKPQPAWQAYRQMLHFYAVKNLIAWRQENPASDLQTMCDALAGPRQKQWDNLGGQLMTQTDLAALQADIKNGTLNDWHAIHRAYDALWTKYPLDRQRHAYATLLELLGADSLSAAQWNNALAKAAEIKNTIAERTYLSRKKDFDNPFRQQTYRNPEEMRAVIGTIEDNPFVIQMRQEAEDFSRLAQSLKVDE